MTLHKRLTTPRGGKMGPALRVAPEKAPLGVARRLFGTTKSHSSRLDWRFFRRNRQADATSTDPRLRIAGIEQLADTVAQASKLRFILQRAFVFVGDIKDVFDPFAERTDLGAVQTDLAFRERFAH